MHERNRSLALGSLTFAVTLTLATGPWLPAWADEQPPMPCHGTWHLEAGQTVSPMGPGAAGGEAEVELRVHDCGKLLILHEFLGGIPDGLVDRDFHRDVEEFPVYTHETSAELPVVVTLRMDSPRRLVGQIDIAGGSFVKPLELTLLEFDPSPDYGCGDEEWQPPEDELVTEIERSEMLEAVVQAMRQQGLSPPGGSGLGLRDYIHVRTVPAGRGEGPSGRHRVHFRLGPDGEILPREDALYEERLACEVGRHELQGATAWLAFKPFRYVDGTHETAAQLIDLETGIIRRQQMASGPRDTGGLFRSLLDSWRALGLPATRLSDGRAR